MTVSGSGGLLYCEKAGASAGRRMHDSSMREEIFHTFTA